MAKVVVTLKCQAIPSVQSCLFLDKVLQLLWLNSSWCSYLHLPTVPLVVIVGWLDLVFSWIGFLSILTVLEFSL